MVDTLSITLAQLNQSVGDIAGNAAAMLAARERSRAAGADLIVFPEMQLIGYPPEDLVLKPALIERAAGQLETLAQATADGGPAMLVGSVFVVDGNLHNGVALLDQGKIAAIRLKHELPNYGTFDEMRLFQSGPLPEPVVFRGVMIGLPICEDIWHPDVCRHLAEFGAELLLCVNGSPYEIDKDTLRIDGVAKRRAVDNNLPLAYVNRVGGQDELVFDGASFVINGDGTLAVQMKDWEEQEVTTRWTRTATGWRCDAGEIAPLADHPEDIYCAMVLALRDYVDRNRFPGVVLGLSGGIDSALVAAIAADAIGAQNVRCVMLPSRFTSATSLEDAAGVAQALGCRLDTVPISGPQEAVGEALAGLFAGTAPGITEENIQSRLRGVLLMALSNKFGEMLLTTGNKSEMAVGYCTIYGDMNGGYNPLKDLYKTRVFATCRWRNENHRDWMKGPAGVVIPPRVIDKPPSAELRENQKDQDSLPPYDVLDDILEGLIEEDLSVAEIVAKGHDRAIVKKVEHLLYISEYKRFQSAPGTRLTRKALWLDRRYPMAMRWRDEG